MEKILKRVKFDIDENEPISGVKAISLVDEPAIMSNFEYFDKAKKKEKFKKFLVEGKEFQGVTHGLALKPDIDILRYDLEGNPYYGYFSKDVIKKIRDKYHREMMTNQFNTDHNGDNTIDAYLIESFIIDSEERLADVKKKGIEDATLGSWYIQAKIEDQEAFERVVKGELNGFSVEVYLDKILETNNYKRNELNVMKFIQEKFKEIQARLDKLANEKSKEKMESAKIAGTETAVEYGEVGEPVIVIEVNEEGVPSPVPAPAGEHVLDNGSVIVVDEAGLLVEIKAVEQEMEEEKKEEEMVDGEEPVAPEASADPVKDAIESKIVDAVVEAVAPAVEESIAPVVEEVVSAAEDAVAAIGLKKEIEVLKSELAKAKSEIEKLKKAPIAKPVSKKEVLSTEKIDMSKLSTFERIALKNGITIPEGLK